jgi:glycosyltransferase involved in cell wall biosynthesis
MEGTPRMTMEHIAAPEAAVRGGPAFSVIIPAFNEAAGIRQTLEQLLAYPELQAAEIIVIDDGSTDETAALVAQFAQVRLIRHRVNRGYGAAIRTGVRNACGAYIIWYDADGQHRPEDLLLIYAVLIQEDLDYCIGVRDANSHRPASRQFGKLILRKVVDVAAGEKVRDFNSGLRGFKREVLVQYLHLLPNGFSASTTTTLIMKERGYVGNEVAIVTQERIGKSTVKQLRDGTGTIMLILRIVLLFKPMIFFSTLGLSLVLIGMVYGLIETFAVRQGFPVFGALVIILGVQTLFFGLLNDQISLQRRERFEQHH